MIEQAGNDQQSLRKDSPLIITHAKAIALTFHISQSCNADISQSYSIHVSH
jgi:hypothetical protein